MKNYKKLLTNLFLILIILFTLTSCSGVVPEPSTPSEPHAEIADSHKVTTIAPYYEMQEKDNYCLIASGVIVTNYEANYGVENPQKVLIQQELADAIYVPGGAYSVSLVNYINSRSDLNLKAEVQYLSILEIQRMIEDDIVPIVILETKKHAIPTVEYNKIKNEITIYSILDGKEHTMYEFEYLDPNSNKSVMIINKEKLSTYWNNFE